MSKKLTDWLLFIVLSVIWGSSFILMKIGLDNKLSPYQIAAIRISASGLLLLPIAIKSFGKIPFKKLPLIFLSGVLGNLLPAFLFCIAEQELDSSLAGMLNSLTPIFVILLGALFFKKEAPANKVIGILIALAGSILLVFSKGPIKTTDNLINPLLIVLATIMYGMNVNIVSKYLSHLSSLQVAAWSLSLNALPAILILYFTGFFALPLDDAAIIKGTVASVALGVFGTAIATILFYNLVKRAGAIFSSMVTYGIPFVAIVLGVYFNNEHFNWQKGACLLVIFFGVFWANRKQEAKGQ
ncbi:MAG: DMT family transporter [Bacteroidota bacterium]